MFDFNVNLVFSTNFFLSLLNFYICKYLYVSEEVWCYPTDPGDAQNQMDWPYIANNYDDWLDGNFEFH